MSAPDTATAGEQDLFNAPSDDRHGLCFMERQFPVSKISKEAYAERRSNQGQTITGLGKWWGRKPLVLVRATILGLLLPATDDPETDREVFLRLMTMDEDGHLRRKNTSIPQKVLFQRLPPRDREKYFKPGSTEKKATHKKGLSRDVKEELQRRVFLSMSYDERLGYCARPEQIDGPSPESWDVINQHLGTSATSLQDLVEELGKRRFGHTPRVGDSFCGGGSIPFEAARLGCSTFASDLNPVATLLTWGAINIIGGGEDRANSIRHTLTDVYDAVDRTLTEWGIEHRDPDPETGRQWRADAFLYCTEVRCPECGWLVPLASSWVVAPTSGAVAQLVPKPETRSFDIVIRHDLASEAPEDVAQPSTLTGDAEILCPNTNCGKTTPIRAIRGDGMDGGIRLRQWERSDIVPRLTDVFQERLFCIRWVDSWMEVDERGVERERSERHFRAPSSADLEREENVGRILAERLDDWQRQGFIPNRRIEPGVKTTEPIRTRGWTHWHQLFTPRQLLLLGSFMKQIAQQSNELEDRAACLLGVGRLADWNSKLCRWGTGAARESIAQTFSNQALNTLFSFASKGFLLLDGSWFPISPVERVVGDSIVRPQDARLVEEVCDIWITDPPYADAISYHEISEFFLAWYDVLLRSWFPEWSSDSRRALAIQGRGESFAKSMVACYERLASQMPDNGFQLVMFTHQDAGVWANLATILWAAGLQVEAAWCVQTEREASGTRQGNYVQGTVLLVLRKRKGDEVAFLDEIHHEVEAEVRRQLSSMQALDDKESPNFADSDYQLAAYAAALRVLTSRQIEDIDVERELTRERQAGEVSPVEKLIEEAVKIAADHLVPRGLEPHLWKSMTAPERFFLKGVEVESHGEAREGVYQEFARGFGFEGYRGLMASTAANQARLKTASELGKRDVGGDPGTGFGGSLVRHALFATWKTAQNESTQDGLNWLKTEMPDYSQSRRRLIDILNFLATFRQNASMEHWHDDADAARLLAGALENDHV